MKVFCPRAVEMSIRLLVLAVLAGVQGDSRAETVTISTPGGAFTVEIDHLGPDGHLAAPSVLPLPVFAPPTVFSAPLPSGSGARALGVAGAFTAIADDATAASWNPAGLVQLERPEASAVFRASAEYDRHRSDNPSLTVGEDDFSNVNLNYLSAVYPFRMADRNWVCSVNLQETYDFTRRFTADSRITTSTGSGREVSRASSETTTEHIIHGRVEVDLTSYLTTRVTTRVAERVASEMLTSLQFEQQGIIDAVSPALAVGLTPRLSAGVALNLYHDSPFPGQAIRSRTLSTYSGESVMDARTLTERYTDGTYSFEGVIHWGPIAGDQPVPLTHDAYSGFSETSERRSHDAICFEGTYDEMNAYSDLFGINATFGVLWRATSSLGIGLTFDLPWTAEARQERRVIHTVTTSDQTGSVVLETARTEERATKDVEFNFPAYVALGLVWRCNNRLYAGLDLSRTAWSDFCYQAEGEPRTNPIDGSLHGTHDVDDCWSARCGVEYLWVLENVEIPFRGGACWEQRPAIGEPNDFWSVSMGSGIALGRDPGRLIADVAYVYTQGNDALDSLMGSDRELSTDVVRHDVFVSGIYHF
ncbi:MAG: outer membrane protein transport protein [Kiritimatiellae bacterium]|nr:outer membrane protein transport protein [Kiritimatiellia bacterium]